MECRFFPQNGARDGETRSGSAQADAAVRYGGPADPGDALMKNDLSGSPEEYIKALMNISQAINSDLYLEDILKLIVLVTAKVTGMEICSLWLIDDSEEPVTLRLKATQAFDPDYFKDRALTLDEGVVGFVATHREPLILPDVLEDERFKEKEMARKLNLTSMVSVPLQAGDDQVVGVFNCFTTQPHDFSETEVNLIKTVANQAAVAIRNADLMVKTRVIQEELETRKTVERAKEVVMRRRNMDGNQAYQWIRQHSMNSRKTIREIAEAILLSESLDAPT